MSQQLKDF
jgi:NIMA (never in mitosis gene a)-related kinase